jgi:hypothetical protein
MSIIEFIQDRARYYNCPVCGRSLKGCEVRMLKHVEDRFTVQVTCAACHVQFIVILAIQGQGLETLNEDELQLEVELEDADAMAHALAEAELEPIASDEVLDVHLILKDFSGSLTELLKTPDPSRG